MPDVRDGASRRFGAELATQCPAGSVPSMTRSALAQRRRARAKEKKKKKPPPPPPPPPPPAAENEQLKFDSSKKSRVAEKNRNVNRAVRARFRCMMSELGYCRGARRTRRHGSAATHLRSASDGGARARWLALMGGSESATWSRSIPVTGSCIARRAEIARGRGRDPTICGPTRLARYPSESTGGGTPSKSIA